MFRKFVGPLALLLALVIGDQIRIHRPDHKYRLAIEVETADGVRKASGVVSVHPDRGYSRGGNTRTKGDAIPLDLGGGKNLIVLLAIGGDPLDLDEINYLAVRSYAAAGQRAVFKQMDRVTGAVPVPPEYMPVLATFSDRGNPTTMRAVKLSDMAATFGAGVKLRGITVEIVPNGFWPLDFGGALGEPVTRRITESLPWLGGAEERAASAIEAAGWKLKPEEDARRAFTRG